MMRESDETQLPLVKTFGEQLDATIANRAGARRRSQRRVLTVLCAIGLLGASLLTSPGRAASSWVSERLGLAGPGDPPTFDGPRGRGHLHQQPTRSVVVAAGRTPDGARYEFVLERFAEPEKPDPPDARGGHCLNLEWPDAGVGQISPQYGCHPTFPPAVIDEAVVRFGGAMFDPYYTTHIQITGLARSDVSAVRILYKDEQGARRDAPVDFAKVTGPVAQRVGANGPFGVFIGFLPQAWLGYGANFDPRPCPIKERPYNPEAIELIAYDDQGKPIATQNGSNGLSTSGQPSCP